MEEPTLDLQAGIAAYTAAFQDAARQALSNAGTVAVACRGPVGADGLRP